MDAAGIAARAAKRDTQRACHRGLRPTGIGGGVQPCVAPHHTPPVAGIRKLAARSSKTKQQPGAQIADANAIAAARKLIDRAELLLTAGIALVAAGMFFQAG
jgi:hypothetical protein